MITALDHIAIAVPDLEAAVRRFLDDFGLHYDGNEIVEAAQTTTAFFSLPETHIELVHPLDGSGPIATYLEKRGGGLHHLCFRTDDIDGDVAQLRDKGYQCIGEVPTPGAHGSRVIFIHPKSCDGVLIELSQPAEIHA